MANKKSRQGDMDFKEAWKPIASFVGVYEVSNLGRVRRIKPGSGTHPKKIRRLWISRDGYQGVSLYNREAQKTFQVHRLVAEAFLGPCPEGMWVNHKDGIKTNNRVDNLEYTTPSENHRHAWSNGLHSACTGERHGNATLTSEQVRMIRSEYETGEWSQKDLAEKYCMGVSAIWFIVNNKTWKTS